MKRESFRLSLERWQHKDWMENQKGMMTNYCFPQKPTPRMSLWVVIKVCQMCHRKLPSLSSTRTVCLGNNYWNIPIVTKIYARKEKILGRDKNLGERWNWAEIRFSVVCARWRVKISDELWIKPVIAFVSIVSRSVDSWIVTCFHQPWLLFLFPI